MPPCHRREPALCVDIFLPYLDLRDPHESTDSKSCERPLLSKGRNNILHHSPPSVQIADAMPEDGKEFFTVYCERVHGMLA